MRWTGRVAIVGTIATIVGVLGAVSPAAALARISVGPSTDLVDGQLVNVAVLAFPANTPIAAIECAPTAKNESGCDTRTLSYFSTGPHGMANTPFVVARNLRVNTPKPNTQIDCRTAGCILGVGTLDQKVTAGYHLTFNQTAPLAPPLTIGAKVNPTGMVNTTSHVATVSGNVTCNRVSVVYLNGEVDQLIPFFGVWAVSRSYMSVGPIVCGNPTKTVPWTAKVGDLNTAADGSFIVGYVPGNVKVEAYVQGRGGTSFASTPPIDTTVTLSALR